MFGKLNFHDVKKPTYVNCFVKNKVFSIKLLSSFHVPNLT